MEKIFTFKNIDNPIFCKDYTKLKLKDLEESGLLERLQTVSLDLSFDRQIDDCHHWGFEEFTVVCVLVKADGTIIKSRGQSAKILDSINNMVDNLNSQIRKISEDRLIEYNPDSFYPYYYSEYY